MKRVCAAFLILSTASIMLFAKEVSVVIGTGEHWKTKMNPQCAVWLEDTDGNYVRTLYVTRRVSKRSWIFAPAKGRPEALPVWSHAANHDGGKSMADNGELDAVTSATPNADIVFTAETGDKEYIIKAEFNTSFDYNDFYAKKNSRINGQPSVVYEAKIPQGMNGEIRVLLAGCGSETGSDGKISGDISKLTTAKHIVKKITAAQK